jgi:hypothetical protein
VNLRELIVSCRDGRWEELAQDLAQWLTFLLEAACLLVLDPESQLQYMKLEFDHNWRSDPCTSHVTGRPVLSPVTGSNPVILPQLPLGSCQVRLRAIERLCSISSVVSMYGCDYTPGQGTNFRVKHRVQAALGRSQPDIQWAPDALSVVIQLLEL